MKAWSDVCKASASPTFLVPGDRRFLINPVVFEGRCRSKKIKFKVSSCPFPSLVNLSLCMVVFLLRLLVIFLAGRWDYNGAK